MIRQTKRSTATVHHLTVYTRADAKIDNPHTPEPELAKVMRPDRPKPLRKRVAKP